MLHTQTYGRADVPKYPNTHIRTYAHTHIRTYAHTHMRTQTRTHIHSSIQYTHRKLFCSPCGLSTSNVPASKTPKPTLWCNQWLLGFSINNQRVANRVGGDHKRDRKLVADVCSTCKVWHVVIRRQFNSERFGAKVLEEDRKRRETGGERERERRCRSYREDVACVVRW